MIADSIPNLEALYPACRFSVLLSPSRKILVYTLQWAKTTSFHILKFPFTLISLCQKQTKNLNFSSLSSRRWWSSLYRCKKIKINRWDSTTTGHECQNTIAQLLKTGIQSVMSSIPSQICVQSSVLHFRVHTKLRVPLPAPSLEVTESVLWVPLPQKWIHTFI
jgi:hypothetical protein